MSRNFPRCALLAAALLAGHSSVLAKEGFGLLARDTARLVRLRPPAISLTGTRIQVKTGSLNSSDRPLAQRLQHQLESALVAGDSGLDMVTDKPEILVEATILQSEVTEGWEDRQENVLVDPVKGPEGAPRKISHRITVRYKVVSHAFAVSYSIRDPIRATNLDADSLRFDYQEGFREGLGAPDAVRLESTALDKAVGAIARRIVPTRQTIRILIPRGSLEDLKSLAMAGQWNLYLEALERRPPSSNAVDDSYRHYALGVSYEALGYAAEDPGEALKYLTQAAVHYNRAVEMNPGEKYFVLDYESILSSQSAVAPLERVQTALTDYHQLRERSDARHRLSASGDAGGEPMPAAERMDNLTVIRMVRAGLSTAVILTSIETADNAVFDISPQGLIDLSEAHVDDRIIRRLQEIALAKEKKALRKP